MNMAFGDVPLVLNAPAWKYRGTANTVKPRTLVLHSQNDLLVLIDDSRELLRNSGLPETALRVVGEEHDMTDTGRCGRCSKSWSPFDADRIGPRRCHVPSPGQRSANQNPSCSTISANETGISKTSPGHL